MDKLVKIGVFYDGGYFTHVNNYYRHTHEIRSRIGFSGLHNFIRHTVAEKEGVDHGICHILDAHFFRGRFSAKEANERLNQLYNDRILDEVLMYSNITPHYLPVKHVNGETTKREKGVDVLMALETFELCMYKRYDVVVLVASDGDHLPLVRKLHGLGSKTMLLGWNFEFINENGKIHSTKVSGDMLKEVSYPLNMSELIERDIESSNPIMADMFLKRDASEDGIAEEGDDAQPLGEELDSSLFDPEVRQTGKVMELKQGFGFIKYPGNNVFFPASELVGIRFDDLVIDQELEFFIQQGEKGRVATHITKPGGWSPVGK